MGGRPDSPAAEEAEPGDVPAGAYGGSPGAPADAPASEPMAAPEPPAPSRAASSPRPASPTTSRAPAKSADAAPSGGLAKRPSVGEGAASRSAVAREEPVAVAPSAGVKAGEWDDNANYREFLRYLDGERSGIHRVDVRDRQFLVVRDVAGKGVPGCTVVVKDETGRSTSFVTTASGRAILFPHAEGLKSRDLVASTSCMGAQVSRRFVASAADGIVELELPAQRALPKVRDIDVAFVLDTTGSMAEEIAAVKSTIQKVASSLSSPEVRVRLGLVEFKDRTDGQVTTVYPMTTNLPAFSSQVSGLHASGGGDTPESVNEGLHVALSRLGWNGQAVARFAFLVGDAPPHLDYPNDADYAVDMRDAAHRGIQIFTVAASGMDGLGQAVWRQIAAYTGATNLFVLRGGAGPQSVGAGDPRSSCGGTQDQYASGNLDMLILRKIRQELRGLDRDPLRIAGLQTDENAKPCSARLVVAD